MHTGTAGAPPEPSVDEFFGSLRGIAWVPVVQARPAKWALVPWPSAPWPRFLAPAAAGLQDDLWTISSTRGIVDGEVSSPLLRERLGWGQRVSAVDLASQVVAIADMYSGGADGSERNAASGSSGSSGSSSGSGSGTLSEAARHRVGLEMPALYARLAEGLGLGPVGDGARGADASGTGVTEGGAAGNGGARAMHGDDDDVDDVLLRVQAVLHNRPWVWAGSGFAPAARVAFRCPANAQPFLHPVLPELSHLGALFRALGVKESFGARELCVALGSLPRTVPLSPPQLDFAVNLVRLLAAPLLPPKAAAGLSPQAADVDASTPVDADGTPRPVDDGDETMEATAGAGAASAGDDVLGRLPSVPAGAPGEVGGGGGGGGDGDIASATAGEDAAAWQQELDAVGAVYCPDAAGVMRLASMLVYNDAPFVGDAVLATYAPNAVHARVAQEWARCVGVGSLRRLLLSDHRTSQALPCPSGPVVQQYLHDHPERFAVSSDLLDLADTLQCEAATFVWDHRTYGQTSLLQQSMASLQGPALAVCLADAVLSAEDLVALLRPGCNSLHARAGGGGGGGAGKAHLRFGDGLWACFHLTDCVQVVWRRWGGGGGCGRQ